MGKYDDRGDLVSTKFPIGWSKAHFNQPPRASHLSKDNLDEEDQETLEILLKCVKLIPHHLSFDTQNLVHARSKSEVQEALGIFGYRLLTVASAFCLYTRFNLYLFCVSDNMSGSMSFVQMKELAKRKREGESSSKSVASPKEPPMSEKEVEILAFRLVEDGDNSPGQDLQRRSKKGNQLQQVHSSEGRGW